MMRRLSGRTASDDPTIDRRTLLAAGAGVATVGLAGCGAVVDFLAGFALDDVNVFNTTDDRHSGSIEVVDPNGEATLDDEFDVPGQEDSDDGEGSMTFGDVLTDAGEYAVTVSLDDPLPLGDGGDRATGNESAGNETGGNETTGNESAGNGSAGNETGGNETVGNETAGNETGGNETASNATDDGAGNENTSNATDPGGPVVETTVEVADPDAEHLVVLLGERDGDAPVTVVAIEEFSDLSEYLEE